MRNITKVSGRIIDLFNKRIYTGTIHIEDGKITTIHEHDDVPNQYLLPGFVDAHIHIESSMVVPYEFAKIALTHGTVATISDPHEIANVVGVKGVHYMIENGRDAKLKFHFGAPSCVPATDFETAGAEVTAADIEELLKSDDIYYLSEMMNWPGVLFKDKVVLEKIAIAKKSGKPIDGHAPGLKGKQAKDYISAGISTDHECFTLEEALDKLKYGMKILIREGSAAKNYNALHTLIKTHSDKLMFCSDDKHPDNLVEGHINELVVRSMELGYDFFDVLRIACVHPVEHYKMDVGQLRVGDKADFIVVDSISEFNVKQTYIEGELVAKNGKSFLEERKHPIINNFNIGKKSPKDFELKGTDAMIDIIHAIDGELITEKIKGDVIVENGLLKPNVKEDFLKISVVNRYSEAPIASGFIKSFNIKEGAIASTVGHDSHNIIVVGTNDEWMCKATNLLVANKGGLSAISPKGEHVISLPVAGLMSDLPAKKIGKMYGDIDKFVKKMGCQLTAPFMTLSFMALLVIPKIKMSDKGLFDAEKFEFL